MSVSRDEALNFNELDLTTTSLLDQSRQTLDQWLSEVSSELNLLNGDLNKQSANAQAASSTLENESSSIQAQSEQACASGDAFNDLPEQIESGLNEVKAQAEPAVAAVQAAADTAQSQLDQTASDAANIGQGVSESVRKSTSSLTDTWADTKSSADQVKESQGDTMDQLTSGNSEMNQSIAEAKAQADALTAQAQGQVNQANASVAGVQSDVEVTRQEVIKAETIVDEEVVKRGGESKMLAVNPPAAQAKGVLATSSPVASNDTQPENEATQPDAVVEAVGNNADGHEKVAASPEENQDAQTTDNQIKKSSEEPASPKPSDEAKPEQPPNTEDSQSETEEIAAPEAAGQAQAASAAQAIVEAEIAPKSVTDESVKDQVATADLDEKGPETFSQADAIDAVAQSTVSLSVASSAVPEAASVTPPVPMPQVQKDAASVEMRADASSATDDIKVKPNAVVEASARNTQISSAHIPDGIHAFTDPVPHQANLPRPASAHQPLDALSSSPHPPLRPLPKRYKLTLWQRLKRFFRL